MNEQNEKFEHNGVNHIHNKNIIKNVFEADEFSRLIDLVGSIIAALGQARSPDIGLIEYLKEYVKAAGDAIHATHEMGVSAKEHSIGKLEILEKSKNSAICEMNRIEQIFKESSPDIYKTIQVERQRENTLN